MRDPNSNDSKASRAPLDSLEVDSNWVVQGCIIPASCNKEGEVILQIQARHRNWPREHYHTGSCPLVPEIGVEIAVAVSTPFRSGFVVSSMDPRELKDIKYIYMAKTITPEESISFITVAGRTMILGIPGLGDLFKAASDCSHCHRREGEEYSYPTPDFGMMEIKDNGKDH